jgi:hypothetical protein
MIQWGITYMPLLITVMLVSWYLRKEKKISQISPPNDHEQFSQLARKSHWYTAASSLIISCQTLIIIIRLPQPHLIYTKTIWRILFHAGICAS